MNLLDFKNVMNILQNVLWTVKLSSGVLKTEKNILKLYVCRRVMKNGVYMFINSDLFTIDNGVVDYPYHLWFWLERDFEKFMSVSIYLGEL